MHRDAERSSAISFEFFLTEVAEIRSETSHGKWRYPEVLFTDIVVLLQHF